MTENQTQQEEWRDTLTEQQLEWIRTETERAATKAVRRWARSALVGFLILTAGTGYAIHAAGQAADTARHAIIDSGNAVAVDGCNRDFYSRWEIREVLVASKQFRKAEYRRGNLTREQLRDALRFYNDRLDGLPLPDCRPAADVLTDDPNEDIRIPTPLVPKDG